METVIETKVCTNSECGKEKPVTEFTRNKNTKDGYSYHCKSCQKCGSKDKELHCHHMEGIYHNPIESADADICITFCIDCHKDVHKEIGCRYIDLQCESKEYVFA